MFPEDLPEDVKTQRLEALGKKLEKYGGRIKGFEDKYKYKAQEALKMGIEVEDEVPDAYMKHYILGKFLEEGERVVDLVWTTEQYIQELGIDNLGEKLGPIWMNAFGVINDYVRTGGENVKGGSLDGK